MPHYLVSGYLPDNYDPSAETEETVKIGRFPEAREEIQRAIAMTQNLREQELLRKRLKQVEKAAPSI